MHEILYREIMNGDIMENPNIFDYERFNHQAYSDPDELEKALLSMDLIGKSIVETRFIGIDFHNTDDWGMAVASSFVEIDEPVVFTLNDNRKLEFNFCEEGFVTLGFDSIPLNTIESYQGNHFLHGDLLFRNVLATPIKNISVTKSCEEPLACHYIPKMDNYIDKVCFEFENGYQILFMGWFDFGCVYVEKIGVKKNENKRKESWFLLTSKEKKNLQMPIVSLETCKVMYDNWEMQCCGKPFHTGSRVTWMCSKIADGCIPNYQGKVDYHYQGHYCDEFVTIVKGVVKSITVRYHTYTKKDNCRIPDKEKSVLVKSVDGWKEYEDGEWEAYDYIVELKNVTIQDAGYRLNDW